MALKCDGIDAQPVIEEKKHCRTLGSGDQQILKFTHGIGADGIAHVRCEEPAIRTLVGENVEVIEPEILHDRFELTIAVNGAVELAHGEFGDDSAGALNLRKACLSPIHVVTARFHNLGDRRFALFLQLLPVLFLGIPGCLGGLIRRGKLSKKVRGRHREGWIFFETLLQARIVDGFWMELLVNPFLEAHLADALDISGAGTIGQAIQCVKDGLILG